MQNLDCSKAFYVNSIRRLQNKNVSNKQLNCMQ